MTIPPTATSHQQRGSTGNRQLLSDNCLPTTDNLRLRLDKPDLYRLRLALLLLLMTAPAQRPLRIIQRTQIAEVNLSQFDQSAFFIEEAHSAKAPIRRPQCPRADAARLLVEPLLEQSFQAVGSRFHLRQTLLPACSVLRPVRTGLHLR